MKRKLFSGVKIGRLTLISVVGYKEVGVTKHKVEIWKCLCDCGNYVEYTGNSLCCRARSCGCLNYENIHNKDIKYRKLPQGFSIKSSEYHSLVNAIQRCRNPQSNKDKRNYYDRGIEICERWDPQKNKNAYANFINDMGKRPKGYMLDRVDNDKGYSPENCKWVTKSQSNKNRRPFTRGKNDYSK